MSTETQPDQPRRNIRPPHLAEITGGTLNWLQSTEDQFSERSMGFKVNSLSGLLAIPDALIIAIEVLRRL